MTRTPAATTYDEGFYAWTQEQAALLRGLSSTGGIDIASVAEAIEDLGKRDLREVGSFPTRLFEHMIEIESRPRSRDLRHWRVGALNVQPLAKRTFSPGMRRLVEIDQLWREGGTLARAAGVSPISPPVCPFTLDELVTDDFDLDAAVARLSAAERTGRA